MKGLDVGTSFLVCSEEKDGEIKYSILRDAFFKIKPGTPFAAKQIELALSNMSYFKDLDNSFILVGEDAINKAMERTQSVSRPMYRGVISPKEPEARRILKFMLTQLVGKPEKEGEALVFSIPAQPIDQSDEDFNTDYHEDCLRQDLGSLGWKAQALNEAEAIGYSELADDEYTGIAISMGSGMANICVMSSGEAIIKFSLAKAGGDWIDRMAAQSSGQPDTLVQQTKEGGNFVIGLSNEDPILDAVAAYYVRLIEYVVKNLVSALKRHSNLPKFTKPISIVIAGGTSLASGFTEVFKSKLLLEDLPFELKEVRHAKDPLRTVARGLYLAASLLD